MVDHSSVVSIHPYFKIHEGKLDEVKALLPEFVAKVENEEAALYYNFGLFQIPAPAFHYRFHVHHPIISISDEEPIFFLPTFGMPYAHSALRISKSLYSCLM